MKAPIIAQTLIDYVKSSFPSMELRAHIEPEYESADIYLLHPTYSDKQLSIAVLGGKMGLCMESVDRLAIDFSGFEVCSVDIEEVKRMIERFYHTGACR